MASAGTAALEQKYRARSARPEAAGGTRPFSGCWPRSRSLYTQFASIGQQIDRFASLRISSSNVTDISALICGKTNYFPKQRT